MSIRSILYVGLGGTIGTLLRYSLYESLPWRSIWITLLCNVCGAFILAFLYRYIATKVKSFVTEKMRLLFGVGLLGGFTTFSTISLDLSQLILDKSYLVLLLYLCATFIGGFIASWLGFQLASNWNKGVK